MPLKIATFRPVPLICHDFWYTYNARRVDYSIWLSKNTVDIKTILFLGSVQIGKLPVWIAEACPPGTIVVQGAPHWLAAEDGSDISTFMHRFAKEVFGHIESLYTITDSAIIAESQAAPCVLRHLATHNLKVSNIVLLQPLGFNSTTYNLPLHDRVRLFRLRVNKNFHYQLRTLLLDRRLVHNHVQMIQTVGLSNPKSNAQYGMGLTYNATTDAKKLHAANTPIVIICGEIDQLFPPHEIKATLQKNQLKIPVIVIPRVPHSPLAAKQGLKLLAAAFNYVQKK